MPADHTHVAPEAEPALKPCPFCGGKNSYAEPDEVGSGGQWVYPVHFGCSDCGAEAVDFLDKGAAETWNKRPIEESLLARIAELEAALRVARERILIDRNTLFDCHTRPGQFVCDDELGVIGIAEYDVVLLQIDAALAAQGEEGAER